MIDEKLSEKKTLINNIVSLFILQGSNYILPLILLPYLVRTLGVEYFGLLAFATATIVLFRGIVSYGFDLSGTKQISIYRDDLNKLNEIFSSIMFVKFILLIVSFLFLLLLISFVAKFQMYANVFLVTFLLVFGDILFPVWFFQGMEKMKIITYIQLTYKTLFVTSVIIFVKNPNEYLYVPILDSIGAILAGFFSLYLISKKFNLSFSIPKYENVRYQFEQGWHIFVSRIAVILYTSINAFALGLLSNNESVGYYSIAEKLYLAARGAIAPIYQALFPFLSKKYIENIKGYYKLVKTLSTLNFIVLLALSVLLYILSEVLVELISGEIIIESTNMLKIFSLALLFSIGNFFSTLLVIKSADKVLSKITVIIAMINITLVFPTIYFFGIYGLVWLFVCIQLIQFIMQIKHNIEIWK